MEHVDMLKGVILPYANFLIFLGLAVYFFKKPAREAARKKKESFEKLMADSRAARDQAVAKLAELSRREANIDKEIAEIRAISQETSANEAAKVVADAERLAAHLKTEAQRIAAAEVDKARAILRQEIVDAVRDGVTRKIKTELNPDAQLTLVRNKIGELNTMQAEG